VRDSIERDCPPDHVWVASEALPPEILRHDRNVGAFLFLRQERAPADRLDAEDIKIVRGHFPQRQLHRVAEAGYGCSDSIVGRPAAEDRLAIAIMDETRRTERQIDLIASAELVARHQMDDA
jgi:hypothetical protein